jgi:hypothetical protein
MKLDPKALEAAAKAICASSCQSWREPPYNSLHTDSLNNIWRSNAKAAISAYCEKAGVVMVPVSLLDEMTADKQWNIRPEMHREIREMIRASQEEE